MNKTIILSAYCAALAAPFTAPFALADAGTAHTDLRPVSYTHLRAHET